MSRWRKRAIPVVLLRGPGTSARVAFLARNGIAQNARLVPVFTVTRVFETRVRHGAYPARGGSWTGPLPQNTDLAPTKIGILRVLLALERCLLM